jgi:hypothetical protein
MTTIMSDKNYKFWRSLLLRNFAFFFSVFFLTYKYSRHYFDIKYHQSVLLAIPSKQRILPSRLPTTWHFCTLSGAVMICKSVHDTVCTKWLFYQRTNTVGENRREKQPVSGVIIHVPLKIEASRYCLVKQAVWAHLLQTWLHTALSDNAHARKHIIDCSMHENENFTALTTCNLGYTIVSPLSFRQPSTAVLWFLFRRYSVRISMDKRTVLRFIVVFFRSCT